jgi:hypothetical protein
MEEKQPNSTEAPSHKPNEPSSTPIEVAADEPSDAATKTTKSWRFWIAFAFLFLCAFISSIDATILGTALPQIAEELNGTSILTFWCATSFFLAKTVVQPGSPSTKSLIAKYWGAYLKLLVENKSYYQ